jgi:hypothetical protein
MLWVFENRVLKQILGPKWEDISGECSEQRNEDLHDLYSLRNFVSVNKTKRMRWVKAREIHGRFCLENMKEQDKL